MNLEHIVKICHPILTVILIVSYSLLAIRLFPKGKTDLGPMEIALAQVARFSLLLTYLTGLILSMNFKFDIAKIHHYASMIPVAVIFFFQFLPGALKKSVSIRGYAFMFSSMLFAVILISVTAFIFN